MAQEMREPNLKSSCYWHHTDRDVIIFRKSRFYRPDENTLNGAFKDFLK